MIELTKDALVFTFPEVHPEARMRIDFQRTLRIPDDGKDYPLPPGLGRFPLRHVDDFHQRIPETWLEHGGVMLPMYQSEAMWLNFSSEQVSEHWVPYPFAIKVAAGKINAVTGDDWSGPLHDDPQDYMVTPGQPWLDGYCVEKGLIRQFVAMPLGAGYSAEEQLTGEAEHGGLQLIVCPMKREVFESRFPKTVRLEMARRRMSWLPQAQSCLDALGAPDMGLAPGGKMRQEIYEDPYSLRDWDTTASSRCFVHIANSMVWRAITGAEPPTVPPTAKEYTRHGLPWFEFYFADGKAVKGATKFGFLKSIAELGKAKGDQPLPENQPVDPTNIIELRQGLKKGQVREGRF
jgi:hypothetical protein